jgi:hypothetical protein
MDAKRFDRIARLVALSMDRRAMGRVMVGAGLVCGAGMRATPSVHAACLADGQGCRRGSQCCSGLCAAQGGRKKCRPAPNQGVCTIEANACVDPARTACGPRCSCYVTLDGKSFCGRNAVSCGCGANNDCARLPGAVCVKQATGCCALAGNTTCVLPCEAPDRPPAGSAR